MSAQPNAPDHGRDLELARAAHQGDSTAWRTIYDETCQPLFNFLCWQTGDRDAARDLLQETYLAALERLDAFRGDGSLLGWLRAVALRRTLDWRRRVTLRLRKLTALAREQAAHGAGNVQAEFPGLGDGVQAALDRLSPRQRAVLLLREMEDQSFADIGGVLGCSEATARVHHHRACAAMRRALEGGDRLVFDGNAGGQA